MKPWLIAAGALVLMTGCVAQKPAKSSFGTTWESKSGTDTLSPHYRAIAERDREIYLGTFLGMMAESDRHGGVQMFSATSGEMLKWISQKDFEDIFINKTRPEYP